MNQGCQSGVMATITETMCRDGRLSRIARAGAFRINSAHVDRAQLASMVTAVRALPESKIILLDTKGPELRTNNVSKPTPYPEGKELAVVFDSADLLTEHCISIGAHFVPESLIPGAEILLDDGRMRLRIIDYKAPVCTALVEKGGVIDAPKTIHVDGVSIDSLPAVSARDHEMVKFAMNEAPVDMIAHSFVRTADDVRALRSIVTNSAIKVIAKIECVQGVMNMESILDEADGLLVARGDLSTAVSPAEIPAVQLRAARLCREKGKICMVATQMLSSLGYMNVPSRADCSDIALAVMEGMQWLLLCDETAKSERGPEAVAWMSDVIDCCVKNGMQCLI